MNDHDDNQRSYCVGGGQYHHQEHQVAELYGYVAHEAMNMSPTVTNELPTAYMAQLNVEEDEIFHNTFPQARHAPSYTTTAYYDAMAWQPFQYNGTSESRTSSWTGFVSPFPDYRVSASVASASSSKPVALFYDREQGSGGQSAASPQSAKSPTQDTSKGKDAAGSMDGIDVANQDKPAGQIANSQLPEAASPAVSSKVSSSRRPRKDVGSPPVLRLSFDEADMEPSPDQLLSPTSSESDASTPPDTPIVQTGDHSPPRKHIKKKARIEDSPYDEPRQRQDRTHRSAVPSKSIGNVYPQIGFAAPRGIPLIPLASSSKRTMSKKPPLACHFCRGRKIACGAPDPSNPDRTCNQCQRRGLVCEYPTESRRGLRKKKTPSGGSSGSNDSTAAGTKVKIVTAGKKAKT